MITDQRQPGRPAELVSAVRQRRSRACPQKLIVRVCIKQAAASKPERGAMQVIGSRFDGSLNDGTTSASELCRGHARIHAKFLGRIHVREKDYGVHQGLVIVNAVQNVVVRLLSEAVGRNGRAAVLLIPKGFSIPVHAAGAAAVLPSRDPG